MKLMDKEKNKVLILIDLFMLALLLAGIALLVLIIQA